MALIGAQRVIKIHDATGRTVAGLRPDDMTLQKDVSAGRHFLRQPCRAIAFDVAALAEAQRAGAIRIEVTDTDTGKLYTVNLNDFHAKAFRVDRGYGPQLALALELWNKPPRTDARQLGLFGRDG